MIRERLARIMTLALPKAPFGRQQWVTVSMSFVLAVALWFMVTLNTQTYTTDFRVPVRLTNFPGEYQLVYDFPDAVEVQTTGLGIKLLYEVFDREDTLVIDYLSFQDKSHFIAHENLPLINALLQDGVSTLSVSPDSVPLLKLKKASKKVPVVLAATWNFPLSYRTVGELRSVPDSVLVTGPVDSLTKITAWSTQAVVVPMIETSTTVSLPMEADPPFVVVPPEVNVSVNPIPFTELAFDLQVRPANSPRFTEVFFDPDSVRVKFLVPFRLADSIRASDFAVDVDFTSIDARSNFAVPYLSRFPPQVEVVGLYPPRVKYLIISKAQ